MRMPVARVRLVLPLALLLDACRDASPAFPETPLGHVGHEWLAAHNRAEGHAVVHFTMLNRGSAGMSGAQMDSAVHAGVQLAQRVGPLTPARLLVSTDTMLVMLLRSADDSLWGARFTPAVQPSIVKIDVDINRARTGGTVRMMALPDPNKSR